jgi:hypothetical protein
MCAYLRYIKASERNFTYAYRPERR